MRTFTRAAPVAFAALATLATTTAHAQSADSTVSRSLLAQHARLATRDDSLARLRGDDADRALRARELAVLRKWSQGPSNAGLYALLLSGGVAYNAACPLGTLCDRDAGGYVDTYHTIDKVAHASTAAALTSFAIQGGVQPEAALLLTIAGGVGFELTQTQGGGYYSGRDVVANSAGAVLAWGWHRASNWQHGRSARAARMATITTR